MAEKTSEIPIQLNSPVSEEEDDSALRVMSIRERAILARERIIKESVNVDYTDEQWQIFFADEIEKALREAIETCAMCLEQQLPKTVEHPDIDVIGQATGAFVRNNVSSIVASVEIEEDGSVDAFPISNN